MAMIRAFAQRDLAWAEELIAADFGGRLQVRLGSVIDALGCSGLVAEHEGDRVGILTYDGEGEEIEVVYVHVTRPHANVGTALLDAVQERTGARRLWVVTTNVRSRSAGTEGSGAAGGTTVRIPSSVAR